MADVGNVPNKQQQATEEASKELECEPPSSLVLAKPKYKHPKNLKTRKST